MRRLSLAKSPYYQYLEKDDNFRRWVESLERGSITTAAVYFRRIGFLSSKLKVEPKQIAAMNTREARDFIHDTISYLETSGNVGSSIESYIKAVKSWLTWNDIELPKKVKIYGAAETPTVENEVTPVTHELRKIFEVGTLRARAVCGMIAFGAFRPEVFGNLVADDGLRIGDMPELRIEHVTDDKGEVVDGKVSFEKVPTMVVVRKSKTGPVRVAQNWRTQRASSTRSWRLRSIPACWIMLRKHWPRRSSSTRPASPSPTCKVLVWSLTNFFPVSLMWNLLPQEGQYLKNAVTSLMMG